MNKIDYIKEWYREKNIKALCLALFEFTPTASQCDIIRTIAFGEHRRVLISAYTRYGKSQCVAIGTALYLLFNSKKRVLLIAPSDAKTAIIRNYLVTAILQCPLLRDHLDNECKQMDRLKKEVSRRRMTFRDGSSIQTLSAHGEGQQLMGFGGDLIIVDELAEIKRDTVNTKITRMLGDDPRRSQFVALFNPWTKDSAAYDMWVSQIYHTIHIPWKIGVKEGRTTEEFIAMEKETLFPWQFEVLYQSMFPDESEDGLIPYRHIENAKKLSETECENPIRILSADVAAYGADLSVLTYMEKDQETNMFYVKDIKSFGKQATTKTVGEIVSMILKYKPDYVNIDNGGMGVAVCDMLIEQGYDPTRVNFGGKSSEQLYLNKKAELFFKAKELFEKGLISIPHHPQLIKELASIRFEKTSQNRARILDPEKSPDYADSLVIGLFQEVGTRIAVIENFVY